ncbi:hypothetical protein D3C77_601130 [compost metagenome]
MQSSTALVSSTPASPMVEARPAAFLPKGLGPVGAIRSALCFPGMAPCRGWQLASKPRTKPGGPEPLGSSAVNRGGIAPLRCNPHRLGATLKSAARTGILPAISGSVFSPKVPQCVTMLSTKWMTFPA